MQTTAKEESVDPDKDVDEMSDDLTDDEEIVDEIQDEASSNTDNNELNTSKSEQCTSNKGGMDTASEETHCDTQRQIGKLESDVKSTSLEEKRVECNCPNECETFESRNSSNAARLLNRQELLDFIQSLHTGSQVTEGVTTIGLVSSYFFY